MLSRQHRHENQFAILGRTINCDRNARHVFICGAVIVCWLQWRASSVEVEQSKLRRVKGLGKLRMGKKIESMADNGKASSPPNWFSLCTCHRFDVRGTQQPAHRTERRKLLNSKTKVFSLQKSTFFFFIISIWVFVSIVILTPCRCC